jgi:hypothetical protein
VVSAVSGGITRFARAQAQNPHVRFVFVDQADQPNTARQYLAQHSLQLQNAWLDPDSLLAARVHAAGYPTTLFYDRNGKL